MDGMLLLFMSLLVPVQTKVYDPNTILSWLNSIFGIPSTNINGLIVFDFSPLVGNELSHYPYTKSITE